MEKQSAEIIEKQIEDTKLKTCFVITPIGEENSSIRRHIDGVINAAIRPALEAKYKVSVAHEFTTTGSINKQVIVEIYKSDLVIANLTDLNPNVMYELAIRHALKKPIIMIMEKGDVKLPFDVANERTIFYKNDFQGVLDLKKEIIRTEENIESNPNLSNPIYDALYDYTSEKSLINKIENENSEDANVLKLILEKIGRLENINSLDKKAYNNRNESSMTEAYSDNKVEFKLEFIEGLSSDEKFELNRKMSTLLQERLPINGVFEVKILRSRDINSIRMLINVKEDYKNSKIMNSLFEIANEILLPYRNKVKIDSMMVSIV